MYVDTLQSDARVAPKRLQRASGVVRLAFRRRGGVAALQTLFQEGSAKARLPRTFSQPPEAILINTAGGLAGGDRFSTEIELAEGAGLVVTTQACERVYRSLGEAAEVKVKLVLAAGARLDWLPQETILFDGGRLSRRLDVDLTANAEFLAVEAVLFGRAAMGERVRSGTFHDRWRIRRDGRLLFADDLRFEGDVAAQLARPAVLAGQVAMATVLYAGTATEALLEPVREAIGDAGGASAWGGKLVVRIAAPDGLALRSKLIPALAVLMDGRPLPKVWQL